jgi:hypothetical protein
MSTSKALIGTAVIILLAFSVYNIAMADDFAPPEPAKIEIDDGNMVFFMTPPEYESEGYLPTGLYYNTESPELIYLVTPGLGIGSYSYFNEFNTFMSDDGMYFAHLPIPFQFDVPDDEVPFFDSGNKVDAIALEFYVNGNLVRSYKVSELVRDYTQLRFSVTMIDWLDFGNFDAVCHYNSDTKTLSIITIDEIAYIFDISTGEILNSFSVENNTEFNITDIIEYMIPDPNPANYAPTGLSFAEIVAHWMENDYIDETGFVLLGTLGYMNPLQALWVIIQVVLPMKNT